MSALPARTAVVDEFRRRFGGEPGAVVRAPGRVNLIGEHTDYNDGFVLPLAINRSVWCAIRARTDGRVTLRSIDLNDEGSFLLGGLGNPEGTWIDYVRGVAWALRDAGHELAGFDGVLASEVPVGAGLSSSAALGVAAARVFSLVSGIEWDKLAMARAVQRSENLWMGVSCGIMDPLICAAGEAGHAILVDCRSLELRPVPLPAETVVVILDTSTRRELAASEYNLRRAECASAAAGCGVSSLRDLDASELDRRRAALGDTAFRRARHVLSENARTCRAAEAMRDGDAAALGRLMNESHQSLRDDFEVSTRILDAMVESARNAPGCYGARLTGAGFGGCVVALVDRHRLHGFVPQAAALFAARTGLVSAIHPCDAVGGAEVMPGL